MDPSAIRDQVDRILHSQSFASKGQLRKLLEILRQNIDSQAALTTELVIKELWPTETKTKQAKDVATEMNRLRRAVESYYGGEGDSDPVIIYFPKRAPGGDGHQETRWIDAIPRNGTKAPLPAQLPSQAASLGPGERPSVQVDTRPRRKTALLALIVAAGLVLLALGYVLFLMPGGVHPQPQSARLDGTVLRIMDADGKELWSKNFPEGFRRSWNNKGENTGSPVWFEDLEGQGHMSVLFAYWPGGGQQLRSSTLICYSDRGKEKWRWTPGRNLPELNGSPAVFLTGALAVLKATPGRPPRIVTANMDPWWPSQIAILDSNGKSISEYWHSGLLSYLTLADLDGDGREEIIATGVANGYDHQATLVVLDPERMSGSSTEVRAEFQIHGMGVGQEKLRLLFPRSDFNRAALFTYNGATDPTVQGGGLRLAVQECPAPSGCPIWYQFDKNARLIAVYAGADEFRAAHNGFYQNRADAHALSAEEQAAFLKVRCLVGCPSEFVPLAQNYDPASSFEKGWIGNTNPNGEWSYGYSAGFTGPVTLYDRTAQNGVNGPNAQYWLSSVSHIDVSPAAEYNRGPAYDDGNVGLLANELLLVAGTGGQYSDLIFTAPVRSEYSIAGNFRGAQYGVGTVVAITTDEKVVFRSSVTSVGQFAPFSLSLNLEAKSRVVFSVGPGGGFQNTGLSATITRPCALADKPVVFPTGEIVCSNSARPARGSVKSAKSHTFVAPRITPAS